MGSGPVRMFWSDRGFSDPEEKIRLEDGWVQCCLLMLFVCLYAGFEKRQAELMVSALVTLTSANMDMVYKDMVTRSHQVGGSGWVSNLELCFVCLMVLVTRFWYWVTVDGYYGMV